MATASGAADSAGMTVRSFGGLRMEPDALTDVDRGAMQAAERGTTALSSDLADFAVLLREASAVWNDRVRALVPAVPPGVSVAERYARAREAWPGEPPPSYEEMAGLLAAIHDASSALVDAAGRFDDAARVTGRVRRTQLP